MMIAIDNPPDSDSDWIDGSHGIDCSPCYQGAFLCFDSMTRKDQKKQMLIYHVIECESSNRGCIL